MERLALSQLIEWKNRKNRKPLILEGARQVGKTWLLKEFGKTQFKNVCYVNFERAEVLKEVFGNELSPSLLT